MRLFVAIALAASGAPGEEAPAHLTLRFLGEVDVDREDALTAAIAEAAAQTLPFDLWLEGVGAFPSPDRPRVVWVGVTIGATEVVALAERLSRALARVGFPPERARFVPHVTWFRVRSAAQRRRALALLSGAEPPPAPRSVAVREILLKESTRTLHGALHVTRAAFSLGRTSRGPD